MKSLFFVLLLSLTGSQKPDLNQDIIYPKAAEVKLSNGETCEVIKEKDMNKARKIFQTYWKENLADSTWANFNRQYVLYNSIKMGTVVYINGACLEKSADFYQKTWCLGYAKAKCYYTAFVNLKIKKVVSFKFNTYDN
ncbi:MAG TPA: hypothetical protein VNZ49_05260 [Bacteroidia bacterium]|jgi:hypothetical protein|nr:hypothetical protein [Bacteroidia bacterium]